MEQPELPERVTRIEERMATKEALVNLERELKDQLFGVERELKSEIGDLRTEMKTGFAELKGLIEKSQKETENKTLKQFIVFWVAVAGIFIPIMNTALSVITRQLLP